MQDAEKVEIGYTLPKERWQEAAKNLEDLGNALAASLRAWNGEDAGTDDIDNLMPACRMCNHYKRANPLSLLRQYIEEIPRKLRDNYIYKVGVAYGEVVENEHPVKFYFEKQEEQHGDQNLS